METITLKINGMHCEGCAQIIQSRLGRLDGVQTMSVSHEAGAARVLFDPARVTRDRLTAAIENVGYRVVDSDA